MDVRAMGGREVSVVGEVSGRCVRGFYCGVIGVEEWVSEVDMWALAGRQGLSGCGFRCDGVGSSGEERARCWWRRLGKFVGLS